jgi:hypothetical protein
LFFNLGTKETAHLNKIELLVISPEASDGYLAYWSPVLLERSATFLTQKY